MNNSQLINQDSGNSEYYTPIEIVNAAREVMGSIDLDPFSSEKANEVVRAKIFYHKERDGFSHPWFGNVWMNHPFSKANNKRCIKALVAEFKYGYVNQACCITFTATSEKWFQPLLDFPQCYLAPRTNYYLPDGSLQRGTPKGSVVTYLGDNVNKFIDEFHDEFGKVKI